MISRVKGSPTEVCADLLTNKNRTVEAQKYARFILAIYALSELDRSFCILIVSIRIFRIFCDPAK